MKTVTKTTQELTQGDELVFAGQDCVLTESIEKNAYDEYVVHVAFTKTNAYATFILPNNVRFDVIPSTLF